MRSDTGRARYTFGSIDGTEYARAAFPLKSGGLRYVLAVRKPIDTIPRAASAVRTAFLTAALVALALTLIIGIPLSARIVRRLRLLRQAALRLAQEGPAVEVPVDRARDEVGDLARTFALMQQQLLQQEEARTGVRRDRLARAAHAAGDARRDARAAPRGPPGAGSSTSRMRSALVERARAQSRRLGRLAADLLDLRAGSTPRSSSAPSRSSSAS